MIAEIQSCVHKGAYFYSDHAVKRMTSRLIARMEVEAAVLSGELIENYPDDKYSPSCLIYGRTNEGRDLHVQLSLPPRVVIITVYEPEQAEWVECRRRKVS